MMTPKRIRSEQSRWERTSYVRLDDTSMGQPGLSKGDLLEENFPLHTVEHWGWRGTIPKQLLQGAFQASRGHRHHPHI